MRLQSIFRMAMITTGVAAVMLFPSHVTAQEIENTTWNDGPNVVEYPQPAPAIISRDLSSTSQASVVLSPSAASSQYVVAPAATISQRTPVQPWMLFASMASIAMIALYALVEARRANRNPTYQTSPVSPRPTLS